MAYDMKRFLENIEREPPETQRLWKQALRDAVQKVSPGGPTRTKEEIDADFRKTVASWDPETRQALRGTIQGIDTQKMAYEAMASIRRVLEGVVPDGN